MLDSFKNFVSTYELPVADNVTLLGISGGLDSMVMADLFEKAGFQYAIAHCNFGLRGNESDEDEKFVSEYFSTKGIPVFTKKFHTLEYAGNCKISIQMAARILRLEWFNELLFEQHLQYFATAHHLNDQLETFFINLLRGTGLAGLHGLLPAKGNSLHPMLFAWRKEINDYANLHSIQFREDSSNRKTDYTRNKIRHQLMPLLKKIKPEAEKVLTENISRIRSAENIFNKKIVELKENLILQKGNETYIQLDDFQKLEDIEIILYEIIKAYGFNYSDALDMIKSLSSAPGRQFFSKTHTITRDRNNFIIQENLKSKLWEDTYLIRENESLIEIPVKLSVKIFTNNDQFKILKKPLTANLDYSLLKFPLYLRRRKKGDYFYPLGMKGKKLLSDYFIDAKFSIPEKDNVWLLVSGEDIVWVVGHRMDDRYKITGRTKKVYQINMQN